jgi:hypothetical protein
MEGNFGKEGYFEWLREGNFLGLKGWIMQTGQSDRHNQSCACPNTRNHVFVLVNDCDQTLISRLAWDYRWYVGFSYFVGFLMGKLFPCHKLNSNNIIFTALKLLMRWLSIKTQFNMVFLGPFISLKKALEIPQKYSSVLNRFGIILIFLKK